MTREELEAVLACITYVRGGRCDGCMFDGDPNTCSCPDDSVMLSHHLKVIDALEKLVANNPGDKEHMSHHEWQALEEAKAILKELYPKGEKP